MKVKAETEQYYDEEIYDLIIEVINNIPVALVIDSKILVMHAGTT